MKHAHKFNQGSGSTNEFNIAVGLVAKTAMLGNAIRLFHFSNQRNIRSPIIGNFLKFAAEVSSHTKFGVEVPRLSTPRDFQMNAVASTAW